MKRKEKKKIADQVTERICGDEIYSMFERLMKDYLGPSLVSQVNKTSTLYDRFYGKKVFTELLGKTAKKSIRKRP